MDADANMTFANPSELIMLGYDLEQIVNLSHREIFHPRALVEVQNLYTNCGICQSTARNTCSP